MPKQFLELTKEGFDALCVLGYTWGDFMRDYKQPSWCYYPEALAGKWGCSSLMAFMVWGEGYCIICECYKNRDAVARQVQFDSECWVNSDSTYLNEFDESKLTYDKTHGTHFVVD